MFSNRRPYYGLKLSIADFFREPVRYLKQSNTQESMMEKPYLVDEYPKMHLDLPDFKYKPKERPPGLFGEIASGVPYGGLAIIDFGEAGCNWYISRAGGCIKEPITITLVADYFFTEEFDFVAQIIEDTIGISLTQLPGGKAGARDEQDFEITFPENATGLVTICGFASTNTLISQTFETAVAGMPVGIYKSGGVIMAKERGQQNPAILLKSSYGTKGADCGCITIESSCVPPCNCTGISIGYTSQQMAVDEVQELTVTNPVGGCEYSWSIESGGGSLSSSTGTSVNYTAPSSNANCGDNPAITLGTNGNVCDTVSLAINASPATDIGYDYSDIEIGETGFEECTQTTGTCTGCYTVKRKWSNYETLNCDGTTSPSGWDCGNPDYIEYWQCMHCASGQQCPGTCPGDCVYPSNQEIINNCIATRGAEDNRSDAQKAAGCCPAQLL